MSCAISEAISTAGCRVIFSKASAQIPFKLYMIIVWDHPEGWKEDGWPWLIFKVPRVKIQGFCTFSLQIIHGFYSNDCSCGSYTVGEKIQLTLTYFQSHGCQTFTYYWLNFCPKIFQIASWVLQNLYRKPSMSFSVVTLNLTFDLLFKVQLKNLCFDLKYCRYEVGYYRTCIGNHIELY